MTVAAQLLPTIRLALPIIMAELGWMTMGVVDTIMVGHVGAAMLAGASTAEAIFHSIALAGLGLLLGLDTLIAQAYGARNLADCGHSLRQGAILSLLLTPPIVLVLWFSGPLMRAWGVTGEVYEHAMAYMGPAQFGVLPLLLYVAFRRYLQALELVRPVMFALLSANLVNVFGNWVLIYGNLGVPAMGVAGSSWATVFSRCYMAGVLIAYTAWREWRTGLGPLRHRWRVDRDRIREILRLGVPAAGQITFEVGVFALATVLAATIGTISTAAHVVSLNTAGLTFMIPLGISSAGAVRVGHAIGAGDPAGARRAGWAAFLLGCGFMGFAGVLFLAIPRLIVSAYTSDPAVIAAGASLLFIAAFFQLFDGMQVVATGVLRGLGDTKTAMLANLFGHWFLGLPLGYALCFWAGWGIQGLWTGLSVGLIAVALVLLRSWHRRSRASLPSREW